ncbi:MAG TPA: L,D-transpeptidase [Jatrophihabitantaceae bacterium]|nr:L,D-transpeptidase [Jatrophihabitantaceae bacterium]
MSSPFATRLRRASSSTATAVALVLVVAACSSNTKPGPVVTRTVTNGPTAGASGPSASVPSKSKPSKSKPPKPTGKPVHVSSAVLSDGSQVGVGMPIILLLSRPIRQARDFSAATTVTVNGHAINGGWYFERKYGDAGHPIEADYRPARYWPGHAQVHMELKAKGKSAGKGLIFDNNLSLDFSTGAAHVLTVDDATHRLTVMSDGHQWPDASTTFPVSLGLAATPTKRGIKVVMEKGLDIPMHGPGYYDPHVKFTQRLTYDGEYLHSAPWNCVGAPGCSGPQNNIGSADSSNGCTNLKPEDAQKLFEFLEIGDVVQYPNASGPLMGLGDGYGDWNVPWPQWQTGGLYPVS